MRREVARMMSLGLEHSEDWQSLARPTQGSRPADVLLAPRKLRFSQSKILCLEILRKF